MNDQRYFNTSYDETIHGPITPADIREGDLVFANVKSLDPQKPFSLNLRVWRISPLGVELISDDSSVAEKGSYVSLELKLGHQTTFLTGLIVDSIAEIGARKFIHIRLVPTKEDRNSGEERRETSRWVCGEQFYPTAVASNPAKFNDFIYFKVKDISFGGFKLTTSLRNKFIIPGLVFDCIINFPMISQLNIKIKVQNVRIELENSKEILSIGGVFDTKNEKMNQIIGQYLMQFGSAKSLSDIQEAGFLVHNVSESVNYSYVKTKEEFEEVMKLRFLAYSEAGKLQNTKTYLDMSDEFDAKSRIIIGKCKDEIVCSARMIFHKVGEALEQEKFVKWGNDLPRPDEVVEIMRACTRPDFRGSDLLIGMFKYMAVTVAQAKKNWIVICATNEMLPFYEKIGFKQTGLSYDHTSLNNLRHHVLVANFADGMSGKTVDPIHWNLVWSESVQYLNQYELIKVDPFMQIRLAIYKWFSIPAQIIYERKIKNRIKQIVKKNKKIELKAAS